MIQTGFYQQHSTSGKGYRRNNQTDEHNVRLAEGPELTALLCDLLEPILPHRNCSHIHTHLSAGSRVEGQKQSVGYHTGTSLIVSTGTSYSTTLGTSTIFSTCLVGPGTCWKQQQYDLERLGTTWQTDTGLAARRQKSWIGSQLETFAFTICMARLTRACPTTETDSGKLYTNIKHKTPWRRLTWHDIPELPSR